MTQKEHANICNIERNFACNKERIRDSLVKARQSIASALRGLGRGHPLITTVNVNFAMYDISKAQCLLTGQSLEKLRPRIRAVRRSCEMAVEELRPKGKKPQTKKRKPKLPEKGKGLCHEPHQRMSDEEFDHLEAMAWAGEFSSKR